MIGFGLQGIASQPLLFISASLVKMICVSGRIEALAMLGSRRFASMGHLCCWAQIYGAEANFGRYCRKGQVTSVRGAFDWS